MAGMIVPVVPDTEVLSITGGKGGVGDDGAAGAAGRQSVMPWILPTASKVAMHTGIEPAGTLAVVDWVRIFTTWECRPRSSRRFFVTPM